VPAVVVVVEKIPQWPLALEPVVAMELLPQMVAMEHL
jgi:hypothetical protein